MQTIQSEDEDLSMTIGVGALGARSGINNDKLGKRTIPNFSNTSRRFPTSGPKRSITVIDEASV